MEDLKCELRGDCTLRVLATTREVRKSRVNLETDEEYPFVAFLQPTFLRNSGFQALFEYLKPPSPIDEGPSPIDEGPAQKKRRLSSATKSPAKASAMLPTRVLPARASRSTMVPARASTSTTPPKVSGRTTTKRKRS
jgi:hypothetical protein